MNKSFTLIEILVVIVVIGILSAFVLVGMSSITNNANIAKSKEFANSMRNSLLIDLVSEWKLDGNANDSWGTNNGTLVGPTHLPVLKSSNECISGTCYQFDGSEDYINCSRAHYETLAAEAWINTYSIPAQGVAASTFVRTDSYMLYIEGGLRWYIHDGTAWRSISYSSLSTNKWYHVVGTYDLNASTNNHKLYVNGVRVAQVTTTNIRDAGAWLRIEYIWSQYYSGLIDEVRIYDQVLPASKIQQNYFIGLNKLYKNDGLSKIEYGQRLSELKSNLAMHE